MKLSIVATLYQSAPYIIEFYERASAAARELVGEEFEIILVNDGSPDSSLDLAIKLTEQDTHVVVVDLSRNFGHHPAMMAGLGQAKGERVFLIDSDLEEDPAWLLEFNKKMEKNDSDVVFGVQRARKGAWFEQISGSIFYRIFNYLSGARITPNQTVARLMSSRYVKALLQYKERELFFGGIVSLAGFYQIPHEVIKGSNSPTTYSLNKKISQSLDAILAFSSKPLLLISKIGLVISGLAFLLIGFLVYSWMVSGNKPLGWTSVIASIWLLSGFLMTSIGVVGLYIAKVFAETKDRPRVIVRSVCSHKPANESGLSNTKERNT